jgi:hypothetical protein
MKSQEKRNKRLKQVLARRSHGETVQRVLEELTAPEQEIVVDEIAQMARLKRLRKLSSD